MVMGNDMHPLDEDTVLFIRKEAAQETQGTIAGQARAKHLPKPLVDGAQGSQISAYELEAASPILDKIKDETLRRSVQNTFLITTKYQALNMLCNPQSQIRKAQPELLNKLINVITEADRALKGKAQQALSG